MSVFPADSFHVELRMAARNAAGLEANVPGGEFLIVGAVVLIAAAFAPGEDVPDGGGVEDLGAVNVLGIDLY